MKITNGNEGKKYKALKSVAYGVAKSFTSVMNKDLMDRVALFVRTSGVMTIHFDLLSGEVSPENAITDQLRRPAIVSAHLLSGPRGSGGAAKSSADDG